MESPEKFDDRLKKAIYAKADKICPSDDLFFKIDKKIKSENMEVKNMKLKTMTKTRGILVACVVLAFTTITCFAAANIASYVSHSTNDTFKELPSEKEVKKEAGFVPKYVDEFAAGYEFYRGGVGESSAQTEDGSSVATVKTANFSYKNGDSIVNLMVSDGVLPADDFGETIMITSDLEGRYTSEMYKIVPSDYIMTEQDKEDEESGKYIFSLGSDEVEVKQIQQISWEDNGMSYTLMNSDGAVDKDMIINMAAEIVNK